MDNTKYLIIIAIKEGENFPVPDNWSNRPLNVVVEARFNDELLISDAIACRDARPQLQTELAWHIDRKSLHLFRIERKPIKLQVFLDPPVAGEERQLIGYIILDLRNAQDTLDPKFEWKTLLNQKYKGAANKRPQVAIALVLTKDQDQDNEDGGDRNEGEDRVDGLPRKEAAGSLIKSKSIKFPFVKDVELDPDALTRMSSSKESVDSPLLEYDLKVRLKNGYHHIWDSRLSSEDRCSQKFLVSVVIAFASHLRKLFASRDQVEAGKPFYFRYSFLGKVIKTEPFFNIDACDTDEFQMERTTFGIAAADVSTLRVYFELHPTIEIQLCDCRDNLYGFVSIALTNFYQDSDMFNPIQGSFMMLPNDESIDIDDPFPMIGVSIELNRDLSSQTAVKSILTPREAFATPKNTKRARSVERPVNFDGGSASSLPIHFCFAIDLRTVTMTDENYPPVNSCYLQFSYPFFGFSDSIKTHPPIKLPLNFDVIVPHGFCSFNFATSYERMEKTFRDIPLIIEVVDQIRDNLIGTAKVVLADVLKTEKIGTEKKQVFSRTAPVFNEDDKEVAKLQVFMSLQNFGITDVPPVNKADVSVLRPFTNESFSTVKNIDDLLMEAALEIELWKEKQLVMFRDELKVKEAEYDRKFAEREKELKKKIEEVNQLDERLKKSLNEIEDKKSQVENKEIEVKEIEKQMKTRYKKLNNEIQDAIGDIKLNYEHRIDREKNQLKDVESEKHKLQERIYFLERKVKEKEAKIKELEEKSQRETKSQAKVTRQSLNKTAPGRVVANGLPKITNTNSCRFRSTSVDARKPTIEHIFNNNNNTNINANANVAKINSKIVGKEINKKDLLMGKPRMTGKMEIVNRLKMEREQMLRRGIPKEDPLIKEVDSKLLKYL